MGPNAACRSFADVRREPAQDNRTGRLHAPGLPVGRGLHCYQLDAFTPPQRPADVIAANAACLAQILRAECEPLSRQERDDALAAQLSFGLDDATVVDWNAALICDPDAYDVRAVLEFANVELLELRFLDDRLDDVVAQAYAALPRAGAAGALRGQGPLAHRPAADGQRMLFEGVNNAVKLLGDQYLALALPHCLQPFPFERLGQQHLARTNHRKHL